MARVVCSPTRVSPGRDADRWATKSPTRRGGEGVRARPRGVGGRGGGGGCDHLLAIGVSLAPRPPPGRGPSPSSAAGWLPRVMRVLSWVRGLGRLSLIPWARNGHKYVRGPRSHLILGSPSLRLIRRHHQRGPTRRSPLPPISQPRLGRVTSGSGGARKERSPRSVATASFFDAAAAAATHSVSPYRLQAAGGKLPVHLIVDDVRPVGGGERERCQQGGWARATAMAVCRPPVATCQGRRRCRRALLRRGTPRRQAARGWGSYWNSTLSGRCPAPHPAGWGRHDTWEGCLSGGAAPPADPGAKSKCNGPIKQTRC